MLFDYIDLDYSEKRLNIVFLSGTSDVDPKKTNCLVYDKSIPKTSFEQKAINPFTSRPKRDLSVTTQQGVLELACRLRDQHNITLGENLFADSAAEFCATEEQIRAITRDLSTNPQAYYVSQHKIDFGL